MIPKSIVLHHSASRPDTSLASINWWHERRDFTLSSLGFYVGYHYVIFPDGTVEQTRRDNEIGCHSVPNDGKIGICFVGNFDIDQPTQDQIRAGSLLVNKLKSEYNITSVLAHSDCNKTDCPGLLFPIGTFKQSQSWWEILINKIINRA
jgi:hypothetical protein